MQVSKKNSSKIVSNTSAKNIRNGSPLSQSSGEEVGVMTFGKSNQSSNYSSIGGKELDGRK